GETLDRAIGERQLEIGGDGFGKGPVGIARDQFHRAIPGMMDWAQLYSGDGVGAMRVCVEAVSTLDEADQGDLAPGELAFMVGTAVRVIMLRVAIGAATEIVDGIDSGF